MRRQNDDRRIEQSRPLIPPSILLEELPVSDEITEFIWNSRAAIADIVQGRDSRVLAIVGPCSIHDVEAARVYAERLREISDKVKDKVLVVMRTYFEKPRTTVGWKGLINDPFLDESYQINKGLRLARRLLIDVNTIGLPTGCEYLDLQTPQHISDVTSWVAIGARTTESQVHRELASGLSMPVGFKNSTDGSLKGAVDAVYTARSQHWFPSITKEAGSAIFLTTGNEDCHVILRGGTNTGPNYDPDSVREASEMLSQLKLPSRVMVDCSHGNSNKDFRCQSRVLSSVCNQLKDGRIMGVMIESNLEEGRQDYCKEREMVFGQSITDECVGIEETERMLFELAEHV